MGAMVSTYVVGKIIVRIIARSEKHQFRQRFLVHHSSTDFFHADVSTVDVFLSFYPRAITCSKQVEISAKECLIIYERLYIILYIYIYHAYAWK